jgi:diacylglycerol O-acyltransferase / wax synthase
MNGTYSGSRRMRLSTQDASFIYADTTAGPLHIGSILLFEGRINFEGFVQQVESRLHLVPRYRQRLLEVPFNLSHAVLEDDPDFRIENHLYRHILKPGISQKEAIAEILRHYEVPLDRKRPLWEMHLFENLEGAGSAVLSKVHHALVDGVSGVELLKVMFDLKPNPDPIEAPAEPWTPEPPTSQFRRFFEAVQEQASTPFKTAVEASRELIKDPEGAADKARMRADGVRLLTELATRRIVATPWNSGIASQRRSIAWSSQSFGDFRKVRNAFGGSINDVVLAILTEGGARYLSHHGYKTEGEYFSVGCPVNVRHKEEQSSLGNRVSMMFPLISAEPMDLVERLRAINKETEEIKAAGLPQALESLMSLGDTVPPWMIGFGSRFSTAALDAASSLFRLTGYRPRPDGFLMPAAGINFIATNVPGVQVPQYMLGHQCTDQIPLVPLGAVLGYGVAILSYNQKLYFGMMADPNLMPDVALMKFYVDEAFAELKKRAQAEEPAVQMQAAAAGR